VNNRNFDPVTSACIAQQSKAGACFTAILIGQRLKAKCLGCHGGAPRHVHVPQEANNCNI
jgi:hypothetical protein